jgi:cobalt/nickel transport system ATP-binding protein
LITIVRRLNKEGKTIIIATHDVNAVAELANRVYVLNKSIVASGTTREIFSNQKLLRENNLGVPEVVHLFEILQCFGYNCEDLPLSIDEAVAHLTRTIEQGGKHIHLHIHEHTHEELAKLSESKYNHHLNCSYDANSVE